MDGLDVHALIDTGATSSAITHRLIDKLELPFVAKRPLGSAMGDQMVAWHFFGLGFVSGIEGGDGRSPFFFADRVGFALRHGFLFDALIGMGIIGQCDLHYSRSGEWALAIGR